jgi:hypothetical protein
MLFFCVFSGRIMPKPYNSRIWYNHVVASEIYERILRSDTLKVSDILSWNVIIRSRAERSILLHEMVNSGYSWKCVIAEMSLMDIHSIHSVL